MEKNTLITIFVFFLLSNQLYKIFWEILKALIYLYAIVIGLNYINPAVSGTLRKYLSFILQFDQNIFQILLSNISTEILKFFGDKLPKINLNNNSSFVSNNDLNEEQYPEEQYQREQYPEEQNQRELFQEE
jgi:hypothetical protein